MSQNPSATNPIYAGSNSLELIFPDSSPIARFQNDALFRTEDYLSISFALQSDQIGQTFKVELLTSEFDSLNSVEVEVTSAGWNFIVIDMNEYDSSSTVNYLLIKEVSSPSPIYIDNLSLNFDPDAELPNHIYLPIGRKES